MNCWTFSQNPGTRGRSHHHHHTPIFLALCLIVIQDDIKHNHVNSEMYKMQDQQILENSLNLPCALYPKTWKKKKTNTLHNIPPANDATT